MIFTVIIALEFKKSLLIVAERFDTVVQIRSVVMIALLAICRKVIILDLNETDAPHLVAFAAVIVALGVVHPWLHLRVCRTCGHVGCCDQSLNRHATKHFQATRHPIIQAYDPPEGWAGAMSTK
jgi:uncharacterized membrane protein (DUF373 family)